MRWFVVALGAILAFETFFLWRSSSMCASVTSVAPGKGVAADGKVGGASPRRRRPPSPSPRHASPPPLPPSPPQDSVRPWTAPSWTVRGQTRKRGAGLLFFAYGGKHTLSHFLGEAANAARSFREHNPNVTIAVVSNNESVSGVFDVHINPRYDLLFAGENLQHRSDKINRQWLTRLWYLAHSPFLVTCANVGSPTGAIRAHPPPRLYPPAPHP